MEDTHGLERPRVARLDQVGLVSTTGREMRNVRPSPLSLSSPLSSPTPPLPLSWRSMPITAGVTPLASFSRLLHACAPTRNKSGLDQSVVLLTQDLTCRPTATFGRPALLQVVPFLSAADTYSSTSIAHCRHPLHDPFYVPTYLRRYLCLGISPRADLSCPSHPGPNTASGRG